MIKIAIISETYADKIQDTSYSPGVRFNPVQLGDDRWFISEMEAAFIPPEEIQEVINYNFEEENETD